MFATYAKANRDGKKKSAQKKMKAAFQTAGEKAQAKAGQDNQVMKGFKVLLKYNVAGDKNQEIIDSFTFK